MGIIDVEELIARMQAIEVEAMAALSPAVVADAVPNFFHAQETFPYFTHRVGTFDIGEDSESLDLYTVPIIARLVVGHLTEGYQGQNDAKLSRYIPQVLDTFHRREWLQSASYLEPMARLRRARVSNISGFSAFRNTGINETQIGTEFTITAEFINQIEQDYI